MIVRILVTKFGNKLVEWHDGTATRRGWIPESKIDAEQRVDERTLAMAAPYGLPLHRVLKPMVIDPDVLATALHSNGLWTKEDILKDANGVARSILQASGMSASQVQTMVRMYLEKEDA